MEEFCGLMLAGTVSTEIFCQQIVVFVVDFAVRVGFNGDAVLLKNIDHALKAYIEFFDYFA